MILRPVAMRNGVRSGRVRRRAPRGGQWAKAGPSTSCRPFDSCTGGIAEKSSHNACRLTAPPSSAGALGIGSGTEIGGSLATFNSQYAASSLNSRSVVLIVSDGYDTGRPAVIARELARLRRKTRHIVWLNPLAGWRSYEPVAQAMQAAMPFLDCFAPAGTLRELAAVEPLLRRL